MVEEFVKKEEWMWKYFKAFIIATNNEMDDLIGWDVIQTVCHLIVLGLITLDDKSCMWWTIERMNHNH